MICKECHKRYTPIEKPENPVFYGFCQTCGTKNRYSQLLIGYWSGVAAAVFSLYFVLFSAVGGWPVFISTLVGITFTFLLFFLVVRNLGTHYYPYPATYKKSKNLNRFFGGVIGAISVMFWIFITFEYVK